METKSHANARIAFRVRFGTQPERDMATDLESQSAVFCFNLRFWRKMRGRESVEVEVMMEKGVGAERL